MYNLDIDLNVLHLEDPVFYKGDTVLYVGKAIDRPAAVKAIRGVVLDVTNDALTFCTDDPTIIFGIISRDCILPELDLTLAPVVRTRPGSWT